MKQGKYSEGTIASNLTKEDQFSEEKTKELEASIRVNGIFFVQRERENK